MSTFRPRFARSTTACSRGDQWQPLCVAGIWRAWKELGSGEVLAMAMLTVNADEHPVMMHMHRLGDEKRSVVILRPADYDEWLHTKNTDVARLMHQTYPATEMLAVPT
ncbi:SOS response-associated peptidase family protein [Burkholderia oklahomensis]|uniref:SOS response-associated peptidase family protein n=1 Tax=Burkholderia oklahomensis TaxID=342113 RepID=UPI002163639E|nr:SOS response-associated peptidase family protein [Burkholderia oklahomensis]